MSRLINDPSSMGVQVVGPRMSELSAVQRKCTVSLPCSDLVICNECFFLSINMYLLAFQSPIPNNSKARELLRTRALLGSGGWVLSLCRVNIRTADSKVLIPEQFASEESNVTHSSLPKKC